VLSIATPLAAHRPCLRPIALGTVWDVPLAFTSKLIMVLIGAIRRECLDHVVVLGERHLRHVFLSHMEYYNGATTHLALNKDAPVSRAIQPVGRILQTPILGGLHHQYIWT
jgi:hypothetical protein